jgi:hypothetical protein
MMLPETGKRRKYADATVLPRSTTGLAQTEISNRRQHWIGP